MASVTTKVKPAVYTKPLLSIDEVETFLYRESACVSDDDVPAMMESLTKHMIPRLSEEDAAQAQLLAKEFELQASGDGEEFEEDIEDDEEFDDDDDEAFDDEDFEEEDFEDDEDELDDEDDEDVDEEEEDEEEENDPGT